MEIQNSIMKKFHSNPNLQIELKDLSKLDIGDLNVRQEVLKFLDYWGLINCHLFPSTESSVAKTNGDGEEEKNSLLEQFYHFETLQLCPPIAQKTGPMIPTMTSGLFPESTTVNMLEYHCNSCSGDCSRKFWLYVRTLEYQKQADFDLCADCFNNRKFGTDMSSLDFILMELADAVGVSSGKWTDQETLLLHEALELYKANWNEIADYLFEILRLSEYKDLEVKMCLQVLNLLSNSEEAFRRRLVVGFSTLVPVMHYVIEVPFHPVQCETLKLIYECIFECPKVVSTSQLEELVLVLIRMLIRYLTCIMACSVFVALMRSPTFNGALDLSKSILVAVKYAILFLGLRKIPGWSFIDIHGNITTLFTNHNSHPQFLKIMDTMKILRKKMTEWRQ